MKESLTKIRLSASNNHLNDIFNDNCYLELGNIDYKSINKLLHKKIVSIDNIADFKIQNKGLGASAQTDYEINKILPYMFFENIHKKDISLQLFITYGILVTKEKHHEFFSPIILIPVNLYYENDTLYVQMIGKPIENIFLIQNLQERNFELPNGDKLDDIYALDKYCMSFMKYHNVSVKLENYLTYARVRQKDVLINHERFSLNTPSLMGLANNYIEKNIDVCQITKLNYTQRNALQKANCGNNFAIMGQLGTGKTTTLINIALNAIKEEKKVLYISNIQETLDYVSNFVYEKELDYLMADLSKSFSTLSQKTISKDSDINEFNSHELIDKYNIIDEYEKALTGKIQNYRFIDVLQQLILLPELNKDFIMEDVSNLYKHEVQSIFKSLHNIDDLSLKLGNFSASKFINIPINHSIKYPNQVITLLYQMSKLFHSLNESRKVLEQKFGFEEVLNYARYKVIISNFKCLDIKMVPSSWIESTLSNYNESRNLYQNLKNEIYKIRECKYIINLEYMNYEDIKINDLINKITKPYFDISEKDKINNYLSKIKEIIGKLSFALSQKEIVISSIKKISKLLEWNFDIHDYKVFNELFALDQFLNNNYFYYKWANITNYNTIRKDIINVQNILQNRDKKLEEYFKYFNSINDLDLNINNLENDNKRQKFTKKYNNVDVNKLINDMRELKRQESGYEKNLEKYLNLTGVKYDGSYDIVKDLDTMYKYLNSIKNNEIRKRVINFLSKFELDGFIRQTEVLSSFVKAYNNILSEYEYICTYNLCKPRITFFEMVYDIESIYNHAVMVDEIEVSMQKVIRKSFEYIKIDQFLEYKARFDEVHKLSHLLSINEKYKFLYGDLFKGEGTNIDVIGTVINTFALYTDCFKANKYIVSSLNYENHASIDKILTESLTIISEINENFKVYNKIFKDGGIKYYYDDLESVCNNLDDLINSKEELNLYLEMTENMKVILKYKLFKLNGYIVNNKMSNFECNFKTYYFNTIYKKYLEKYPFLESSEDIASVLDKTLEMEDKYLNKNIDLIKTIHPNKGYTPIVKSLQYLNYIEKCDNKHLYLSNTQIMNLFLDPKFFDLIIIDDAHLLDANEYYKAINGNQIILSGEQQLRSFLSSNLISRIRESSVINFKYRFNPTPLQLLDNNINLKGNFYGDLESNEGIEIIDVNFTDYLYQCLKKNNKVNFFTFSLNKQRIVYEELTKRLINDKYDLKTIIDLYKNNLNICNLHTGYIIDADYNIIDFDEYNQKESEEISLPIINDLLACKKKLVLLDIDQVSISQGNSLFLYFNEIINSNTTCFNNTFGPLLTKIILSFTEKGFSIKGSYGDISLVMEKNNRYFGIIVFFDPNTSHYGLLNDYRDLCNKNGFKVVPLWINDLVFDYNSTINKTIGKLYDK